ncbi:MAG: hypothetical protein AAFO77_13945, partial [Pseudomonadota bacterium]
NQIREDIGVYKRMRMFVISHLFGPFLGHPITVYLFLNDPVNDAVKHGHQFPSERRNHAQSPAS